MLAATVALFSSLVACDIGLQNDQLGVTIDESGRVRLIYLGCRDRQELVESAAIVRARGSLGGNDDEVVWRVHSTDDHSVAELVVGAVGEGYEEDVPVAEPLEGEYTIVVTTSLRGDVTQGVDIGQLRAGQIDTGLGIVSPAEFEHQAIEACA